MQRTLSFRERALPLYINTGQLDSGPTRVGPPGIKV